MTCTGQRRDGCAGYLSRLVRQRSMRIRRTRTTDRLDGTETHLISESRDEQGIEWHHGEGVGGPARSCRNNYLGEKKARCMQCKHIEVG